MWKWGRIGECMSKGELQPGGWIKYKKDRYKPHECPRCGNIHTKQGPFCGRSCGNVREMNITHTSKIAQAHRANALIIADRSISDTRSMSEYGRLAVLNQTARLSGADRLSLDDLYLGIITPKPLDDNQFVQDGDIWTEF